MRLRYFIDYRFDNKLDQFLPIGIWIQDMDDLGIEMYYQDENSEEYWEAMFVINRLVEQGLNAPSDFLEFHQARAGYKGMRSRIFEEETDMSLDGFMRETLNKVENGED
ncbi:MAG: hypothetical protein P9M15_08125 [Candidatus Electryoneaceae bacterium]|nr:hypothetical protein [Candidatus Electryoneaceae bacterium]